MPQYTYEAINEAGSAVTGVLEADSSDAAKLRLSGMERREAIVEAGVTRLRPILMTSLTTILGLVVMAFGGDAGTALMLAIFALQDSFGTACNVTGDGALTLMLTGYAEKHGIADTGDLESPIL